MVRSDLAGPLVRQMQQLEQADLIRLVASQPDLEYIFRHALLQESTYQTLVRADRRRTHRAVGETLETLYGRSEFSADIAPQLARHFDEAGDDSRAVRYYRQAGDAALAHYANVEAVAAFNRALACAERSSLTADWQHLFTARGRALELNSQYELALANYERMSRRAAALGDRHLALAASVACGQLYATATPLFDPARAEQMAEAALAEARALGDEAAEARILWNQLNLYRLSQRNQPARQAGEQSLEISRRLGLAEQAALALNDLIHVYSDLGLWPEANAAAEEAGRLWRDMGNSAMLADSLSTTALYLTMLGQLEAAIAKAQQALDISRKIGNLWGQSYACSALSVPYWYLGYADSAMQACEDCIRLGQAGGYLVALVFDRARLAYMYGEFGDIERGLDLVSQAEHSAQFAGGVGIGMRMWVKAHLEIMQGNIDQAQAARQRLEAKLYAPSIWEVDPQFRARAEVALAGGDAAGALSLTQTYLDHIRQLGLTVYVPDTLLILARALLRQGQVAEARQALLEALNRDDARRSPMIEWPILFELGQLEHEAGESDLAGQHWTRAREIVLNIAARAPTPELRQSFLARPDLRQLFGLAPASTTTTPQTAPVNSPAGTAADTAL